MVGPCQNGEHVSGLYNPEVWRTCAHQNHALQVQGLGETGGVDMEKLSKVDDIHCFQYACIYIYMYIYASLYLYKLQNIYIYIYDSVI